MDYHNPDLRPKVKVDPLPPPTSSLTHKIEQLAKPQLLDVLLDDLPFDNTVKFNGTFRGLDTVSLGATLHLNDSQSPNFSMSDEIGITLRKFSPLTFKFHVKDNIMFLHTDFGQTFARMSFMNVNLDSWINPYFIVDTNRFLNKFFFNIGVLSVTESLGVKNMKITAHNLHNRLAVDGTTNCTMRYGNFFLNSLLTYSLFTPWITTQRDFILGADFNDFVAAVQIDHNKKANWLTWNIDALRLLLAYNLKRNGHIGVEVNQNMDLSNNPKFSLAYQYVVNRYLLLKTKLDSDLNANMFVDYTMADGLTGQLAVRSNLTALDSTKGFLGSPVNFGLRFSLNR
jgi:hypothetical protein